MTGVYRLWRKLKLPVVKMHYYSEIVSLRLVANCIFGASFVVLLAEFIQPGTIVDQSMWRSAKFTPPTDSPKTILFWTEYFSENFTSQNGQRQNAQAELDQCSAKNCILTHNRSFIQQSDAVFFHIRDLQGVPLPTVRAKNQYYIFYLLESPQHTLLDLNQFEGFFNLTFTYRLDADLPAYDYHRHYAPTLWTNRRTAQEFQELWKGKTGFAAIFLSYCSGPSMRILYLEELSHFMPLDVFGNCGQKQCNPKNSTYCDGLVATYKFYLAFENSVCKDYMTEKVYRALNHGTIPVVYGGANYTALLPPRSFINVLDFPSPESLARYLNYLSNNPIEYGKYLMWRFKPEYMTIPKRLQPEKTGWCRLCKLLNRKNRPVKVIRNLTRVWSQDTDCRAPAVVVNPSNGVPKWWMNPVVDFH